MHKISNPAFENLNPDSILDAIESTGRQCDGRTLALNSYENRVYRIGIENQESVITKFYRPGRWSDEQILEDHSFSIELADKELPVVAPIIDDNKITLHKYGPFRFSIYPLRGGRAPELDNSKQLEQMGRFIARLHLVGETQSFSSRLHISPDRLGVQSVQFLLENEHIPAEVLPSYRAITNDLLSTIQDRFNQAGAIQKLRIHADLHPGNILWRNKTPHIVDLDDCSQGPAIQDLWMFLSGDRNYQMARLGDLLTGYEQFRAFNKRELMLTEPLRALRQISYTAWLAKRWNDPAFKLAFPWFGSTRYWDDHILALREQRAALDEPCLQW